MIFLRPERVEACLLPSSLSAAPLIGDFFCSRWPGYFLKSRPYLPQPSFFLLSLSRSFSCAARPCHLHGCVLFGRPVCSSPAPKPSARSPSRPSQPPLLSPAEAPYARSSPIELVPAPVSLRPAPSAAPPSRPLLTMALGAQVPCSLCLFAARACPCSECFRTESLASLSLVFSSLSHGAGRPHPLPIARLYPPLPTIPQLGRRPSPYSSMATSRVFSSSCACCRELL